jgi:hypothetical protein
LINEDRIDAKGREVYSKDEADALETDLQPLVGGVITRISKHDSNPEHPQMPERYRVAFVQWYSG